MALDLAMIDAVLKEYWGRHIKDLCTPSILRDYLRDVTVSVREPPRGREGPLFIMGHAETTIVTCGRKGENGSRLPTVGSATTPQSWLLRRL